jgi:NitT/TauT family transport system permease protein
LRKRSATVRRRKKRTSLEQDPPITLLVPSADADDAAGEEAVRPGFAARWRSWRRPLTTLVILLLGWELLGRYVLTNPLFFAPLSEVVAAGVHLWRDGELEIHIWVSLSELLEGVAAAIVFGIAAGVGVGISQRTREYIEIYITALYATPLVAVTPLLILWLGIGVFSKAAVVFLTAVFPILINTASGVRATDAQLIEVAQSFCATRRQIILKVMLPAAVPFMLTGIRLGIGRGIVGVVVGELFGARAGLGYLIFTSGQTFDVPALFVGIITLAAMGVGLTLAAELVERRALRWRRPVTMG